MLGSDIKLNAEAPRPQRFAERLFKNIVTIQCRKQNTCDALEDMDRIFHNTYLIHEQASQLLQKCVAR